MTQPTCPYCEAMLKKHPLRKTKCPSCGRPIYFKSSPGIAKRLLTEEEAFHAEQQWQDHHDKKRLERSLSDYGLTPDDLEKAHARFFGKKSIAETYQLLLLGVIKHQNDFHLRKMASLALAWELARDDGDYRPYIAKKHLSELQQYNSEGGFNHVRIIASGPGGKACPVCRSQDGRIFQLTSELRLPHLPIPGCTCRGFNEHQIGFCLCYYEPVFDGELP